MAKSSKAELEERAWRECKGALNSLWQSHASWCFREPVDEEKHHAPNYYAIIKDPQDLLTIRTRLESNNYSSPSDVDAAVRQMCQNAFTYNDATHSIHKSARLMLAQWDEQWNTRRVNDLWEAAKDPANAAVVPLPYGRRGAGGAGQPPQQALPQPPQQPQQPPQPRQPPQQQQAPQQRQPQAQPQQQQPPLQRQSSAEQQKRLHALKEDQLRGQYQRLLQAKRQAQQQPQQQQQQQAPARRERQASAGRQPGVVVTSRLLPWTPDMILRTRVSDKKFDASPLPLLQSLLRAAAWLPPLFLACGGLRAQMLGGRASDPELLLVRCLCPECGRQELPGYMPLMHFHMHAGGPAAEAAGLDEASSHEGAAGPDAEEGGPAGGGGGRARVRVADLEVVKQRLWGALRCGGSPEQADNSAFLEVMRARAEAGGGAALVDRRVWLYHFSELQPKPYGTWLPGLVTGYRPESGEHEVRYDHDPLGPLGLVQLGCNFLHWGAAAPGPGQLPADPGGNKPPLKGLAGFFAPSELCNGGRGAASAPTAPAVEALAPATTAPAPATTAPAPAAAALPRHGSSSDAAIAAARAFTAAMRQEAPRPPSGSPDGAADRPIEILEEEEGGSDGRPQGPQAVPRRPPAPAPAPGQPPLQPPHAHTHPPHTHAPAGMLTGAVPGARAASGETQADRPRPHLKRPPPDAAYTAVAASAAPAAAAAHGGGSGAPPPGSAAELAAASVLPLLRDIPPIVADAKVNRDLENESIKSVLGRLLNPAQRARYDSGDPATRKLSVEELFVALHSDPAVLQRAQVLVRDEKRRCVDRYLRELQARAHMPAAVQAAPLQQAPQQAGQHAGPQAPLHRPSQQHPLHAAQPQQAQHTAQQQPRSSTHSPVAQPASAQPPVGAPLPAAAAAVAAAAVLHPALEQQQRQQQAAHAAAPAAAQQHPHVHPHPAHLQHMMYMQQIQMQLRQQQQQHAAMQAPGAAAATAAHSVPVMAQYGQPYGQPFAAQAPYGVLPPGYVQQPPQQAPPPVHGVLSPLPQLATAAAPYPAAAVAHRGTPSPPLYHPAAQQPQLPGQEPLPPPRSSVQGAQVAAHLQTANRPRLDGGVPAPGAAAAAPGPPLAPLPHPHPLQRQETDQRSPRSQTPAAAAATAAAAAATAASSGGRGSVSGGAEEEAGGGGVTGGGRSTGGGEAAPAGSAIAAVPAGPDASWAGSRFRPMLPSVTDLHEVLRAVYDLMEQLPLAGEEARALRKALRQLQAADKDFILANYVNLCYAAKAGEEDEIRDIFEEIRQRADSVQPQGAAAKRDAG